MAKTIFEIPVERNKYAFRLNTELDNRTFIFDFYYNVRNDLWHFNLYDAEETPLLMGRPLNTRYDLLRRFKYNKSLPQGILMLYDKQEKDEESDSEQFGNRWLFLYRSDLL